MILRQPRIEDIQETGRVIFEAFRAISERHNFPPDFQDLEAGVGMAEMVIKDPNVYGVIAEVDGKIVGSNFLWEQDEIAGVGPITIAPHLQSNGVGKKLMLDVISRGKSAPGIRLVQAAFNSSSMSLYASLGFEVVEPLVHLEGSLRDFESRDDVIVRPLVKEDFKESARLCREIHGFDRKNEVKKNSKHFQSFVALHKDKIVGYITAPGNWHLNHAVAKTPDYMKSLLSGAAHLSAKPLSFLLPTRQGELFRWCLSKGMRVMQPLTLMAMGSYQQPKGSFLPSVLY